MSFWLSVLNAGAVSLFGSVLAACFCNALHTRRNRWIFALSVVLILLLHAWAYSLWDMELLRKIYPLITHLPLWLVLCALTGKRLWPLVSVLAAYLCCQLRRWIALFIVAAASGGAMLQDIVELVITVPLLLFLLRFVSPSLFGLSDHPAKSQSHFIVIPALYYAFDYLTRIYTDLLSSGSPVAVEFMPFVCCGAYLLFLLHSSAEERKQNQLRQIQSNLDLQLGQAVHEIDALRKSQTLASQYRHDLRHHLQYLSSCIQNGQGEQAQTYISTICKEIEAQKVERYCENEAANLILSAFAGRAQKNGVEMNVQGTLPAFILVSDNDLCVLLSNALENALHACQPFAAAGTPCCIDVQFYQRANKFFLQVENPYCGPLHFKNGIPTSNQPGHGIGVQSICAIVERYGGVYAFLAEDGKFTLRLSL